MACSKQDLFADGAGGARSGGDGIDDRDIISRAPSKELFKKTGGRQKRKMFLILDMVDDPHALNQALRIETDPEDDLAMLALALRRRLVCPEDPSKRGIVKCDRMDALGGGAEGERLDNSLRVEPLLADAFRAWDDFRTLFTPEQRYRTQRKNN